MSLTHDVAADVLSELMKKQAHNKATREDKLMIEKYMYKKNWGIETVDSAFLDKYFGKTYMLFNLRAYLNPDDIVIYQTVDESDTYIILFDRVVKVEQIRQLKEVLNKLGFKNVNDVVIRDTFNNNKEVAIEQCKLFTDPKSKALFGFKKTKFSSIKDFLGTINGILDP
jgi:hypothetical protein